MTNVRCPVIKICHVSVTHLNFDIKRNKEEKVRSKLYKILKFPTRFYVYLLGEVICTSKIDNDLSKNR